MQTVSNNPVHILLHAYLVVCIGMGSQGGGSVYFRMSTHTTVLLYRCSYVKEHVAQTKM